MTLNKETSTEILRLYHAEKWKIGTIARQLGVHHSSVRRVIEDAEEPRPHPRMLRAAWRRRTGASHSCQGHRLHRSVLRLVPGIPRRGKGAETLVRL